MESDACTSDDAARGSTLVTAFLVCQGRQSRKKPAPREAGALAEKIDSTALAGRHQDEPSADCLPWAFAAGTGRIATKKAPRPTGGETSGSCATPSRVGRTGPQQMTR